MPRNRLQNPSFQFAASGVVLPLSGLTNGVLYPIVQDWNYQQDSNGGTPPAVTVNRLQFPFSFPLSLIPGEPNFYLEFNLEDQGSGIGPAAYQKFNTEALGIRVLNGVQAMFSFWANSSVPEREICVQVRRNYGTGTTATVSGGQTYGPETLTVGSNAIGIGSESIVTTSNTNAFVGQIITGTGIPTNTTVTSVNLDGVTITISNALTIVLQAGSTLNLTCNFVTIATSIVPNVGDTITGTGIAAGTLITAIPNLTTLILSQNTTAVGSGITFTVTRTITSDSILLQSIIPLNQGWQRYGLKFPVLALQNTVTPISFGTNDNGYLACEIFFSGPGSLFSLIPNASLPNVPCIIDITQPQLEYGGQATGWEYSFDPSDLEFITSGMSGYQFSTFSSTTSESIIPSVNQLIVPVNVQMSSGSGAYTGTLRLVTPPAGNAIALIKILWASSGNPTLQIVDDTTSNVIYDQTDQNVGTSYTGSCLCYYDGTQWQQMLST